MRFLARITCLAVCALLLAMTGCATNTSKARATTDAQKNSNAKPGQSKDLSVPPPPSKPPSIGGSQG
jgi:hypothetical protein